MKIRFLGTMDSAAIPVHNCKCIACDNHRKENKINFSTSAVIEYENKVILLDAGIENISNLFDGKEIKAVILTHFHADHVLGLLRLRYSNDKIDCYHPKDEEGFVDLFKYKKSINYIENTPLKEFIIDDIIVIPIPLIHSKNTTGYIIKTKNKTFAYLTDCQGIEKSNHNFLKNYDFDYLFIDACFIPSKQGNHLNYEEAIKLIDSLNVKNAFLMHQSHTNMSYLIENNIELKYKYLYKNQEFEL